MSTANLNVPVSVLYNSISKGKYNKKVIILLLSHHIPRFVKTFSTIIKGGGWNRNEEKSTQLWFQSIVPASYFPETHCHDYYTSSYRLQGLFCAICIGVLDQILQLEFDHLVFLPCCWSWLEVSHAISFPCCYGSDLYPNHARAPSTAIISVLSSLQVNCLRGFHRTVDIKQFRAHFSSQCKDLFTCSTLSPSHIEAVSGRLLASAESTQANKRNALAPETIIDNATIAR